jgi:hypothetical protein
LSAAVEIKDKPFMPSGHQTESTEFQMQPVMVSMTIMYAAMLEVGLTVGHYFSGGKWPSPVKYVVVAAVMILALIYKMKLPKGHAAYVHRLSRVKLSAKQALLMFCYLMGWALLFAWLACGPPGPEFAPA